MLRNLIVGVIISGGFLCCFWGPFPALLFYLWIAYFRPDAWVWTDWFTAARLSLVVGVIVVFLTVVAAGKGRVRRDFGLVLILLFFLQSFVSTMYSASPAWSWQWWSDFAKVLVIGVVITVNVTDEWRYRVVLLVIGFSLGLEAAKQGWVQLLLNPGGRNFNEHPVLGDNNGVALGMFMLVPVFAALAATSRTAYERWIHRFFLVGVLVRGIATYSRGGFLAAAALAFAYSMRSQRRWRAMAGCVALCGLVLVVMPGAFWDRMSTIRVSEDQTDASAAGRLHFWGVAWQMALDHPATGVGFNAFTRVYDRYDTSDGEYGTQRAVHSTWFGALAENGFPGIVLLVSTLSCAFLNCWRTRNLARAWPDADRRRVLAFSTGLEASLVTFVVGGSFINGHYSEMFWHFVCLSIALKYLAIDTSARLLTSTLKSETPTAVVGGRSRLAK